MTDLFKWSATFVLCDQSFIADGRSFVTNGQSFMAKVFVLCLNDIRAGPDGAPYIIE
jgi:hypothetical protein